MRKNKILTVFGSLLTISVLASCGIFKSTTSSTSSNGGEDTTSSGSNIPNTSSSSQTGPNTSNDPQTPYRKVSTEHVIYDAGSSSNSGVAYLKAEGKVKVPVIPVAFTDYTINDKEKILDQINVGFTGKGNATLGFESVESFYEKSSYGKLDLEFVIADTWFDSGYSTSEVSGMTSEGYAEGPAAVLQKALKWGESSLGWNLQDFDGDKDGYVDGAWMIYGAPNYTNDYSLDSTFWAFTWWDYTAKPSVSRPTGLNFGWASYDFLYDNQYNLNKREEVVAHTLIHESGHMLGLADYYDTTGNSAPMGYYAMMDQNIGDHDAYSKFQFGWVEPYLANAPGSITLRPFSETGDCLLIPTSKGYSGSAFEEYLMVEFYAPTALNEHDATIGLWTYAGTKLLPSRAGIRLYHVDARLLKIDEATNTVSFTNDPVNHGNSQSYVMKAFSNTAEMNMASYYMTQYGVEIDGYDNGDYREVTLIDGRTTVSHQDRDVPPQYFYDGSSFNTESYKRQFPASKGKMNNGGDMPYTLEFSINEKTLEATVVVK